jgi:ribosomal protein L16 Arg81 hydroxylase
MAINSALADILDETVTALRDLDSDALHALKQQIVTLAESSEKFESDHAGLILSKRRLLEIVLQNCQVNLDALTRLHARNVRKQWAQ